MARTPVWREIHDALKREIEAGDYRTGDRLPTEKALSDRFGVNRHTVRRALAELTGEGAITVRRGSGAYVAEGVIDYSLSQNVKFSQNILQVGRVPAHRLVRREIVPASRRVATYLSVSPDTPLIELTTVGEADGIPVNHVRQYLPARRFAGLAEIFEETLSLTKALAHFGVTDYRRAWTRITASAASRATAALLRQPESQPILRTEGVNLDMAGQPIEYGVAEWAAARTQFVVDTS
jgi:GntR family phosphonate transport system transcriptional regulator